MLGSELLKWSAGTCDAFALASVDHLNLAIDSADPQMGEDVVTQVIQVVEEVKHPSAHAMIKRALLRRGFMASIARLRQYLLDSDRDVYYLDTTVSEAF